MQRFESTVESTGAVTPRRDSEIETAPASAAPWRSKWSVRHAFTRLLGDFELHGPLCFLRMTIARGAT